jgi:hypothetical protein
MAETCRMRHGKGAFDRQDQSGATFIPAQR